MMLQDDGDVEFSAETNPLKRQMQSDEFSIFGKKFKKKKALDVLKDLSGSGDDGEEDDDLFASVKPPTPKRAELPRYRAADLYGGLYSQYGGRKLPGLLFD